MNPKSIFQFIFEELFHQSIDYKHDSKSSRTKRIQTVFKNGGLYSNIVMGFCLIRGIVLFVEPSSFGATIAFSIFLPIQFFFGFMIGYYLKNTSISQEKDVKFSETQLELIENRIGFHSSCITFWATLMIPITLYFEHNKFDKGIQFMMTKMAVLLNHIILMQPSRVSKFFEVTYSISYFIILVIKSFSFIDLFFASGACISTYFVFCMAEKFNLEYIKVLKEKDKLIKLNSQTFKMINDPILIADSQLNKSLFSNTAFNSLRRNTNSKDQFELLSKLKDEQNKSLYEIIQNKNSENNQDKRSECQNKLFTVQTNANVNHKLTFLIKQARKQLKHSNNEEIIALYFHDIGKEIDIKVLESNIEFTYLLLYSLSHEVRTPLNGMQGILQLMKNKSETKYYKQIKYALSCSEFLVNQINCILDYSQIIKSEFKLHLELVDIKIFSNKIKKRFENIIENKKTEVKIIVNVSENITNKVILDVQRIKQVLLNLLTNSIKYTTKGHITILAMINTNYELDLSISDTGCGFESSEVEIFNNIQPNSLIHLGREGKKFPGYKLSICQILLGELKTKLILVSTKNIGSTFSFSISLQKLKKSVELDVYRRTESGTVLDIDPLPICNIYRYQFLYINQPLSDLNNKSSFKIVNLNFNKFVIIADDVEMNRFVIVGMLKKLEILNSIEAINGKEALELAKEKSQKGDEYIILMDIDMPVMNGLESTKCIREFSQNPIIAVTAFIGEEMRSKARESGMNDFISKPVSFSNLKAILKEYNYL